MPDRGKRYVEAAKQIDRLKLYDPREALGLLRQVSTVKRSEERRVGKECRL